MQRLELLLVVVIKLLQIKKGIDIFTYIV